jgi:hypothetical protein
MLPAEEGRRDLVGCDDGRDCHCLFPEMDPRFPVEVPTDVVLTDRPGANCANLWGI